MCELDSCECGVAWLLLPPPLVQRLALRVAAVHACVACRPVRRHTRRAASAQPPASAAAAVAAAAKPAATLPRRPVSAAVLHRAEERGVVRQHPELTTAPPSVNPVSPAAWAWRAASPSSPRLVSAGSSPRPPHTPAAPLPCYLQTAASPSLSSPLPTVPAPVSGWPAPAAHFCSHHASAALSFPRPTSASPARRGASPSTSPRRPRGSAYYAATIPRPRSAALASAAQHTTHLLSLAYPAQPASPAPPHPAHLAAAAPDALLPCQQAAPGTDSQRVLRGSSGGGLSNGRAAGATHQRTTNTAADTGAAGQRSASRPPPPRQLPQWGVHARAPEDLLQFHGRDRGGFDTVAGLQGGVGAAAAAGSQSQAQEAELPVGAVSTAIFMAQASSSMDGLRGLGIRQLPTQARVHSSLATGACMQQRAQPVHCPGQLCKGACTWAVWVGALRSLGCADGAPVAGDLAHSLLGIHKHAPMHARTHTSTHMHAPICVRRHTSTWTHACKRMHAQHTSCCVVRPRPRQAALHAVVGMRGFMCRTAAPSAGATLSCPARLP